MRLILIAHTDLAPCCLQALAAASIVAPVVITKGKGRGKGEPSKDNNKIPGDDEQKGSSKGPKPITRNLTKLWDPKTIPDDLKTKQKHCQYWGTVQHKGSVCPYLQEEFVKYGYGKFICRNNRGYLPSKSAQKIQMIAALKMEPGQQQ